MRVKIHVCTGQWGIFFDKKEHDNKDFQIMEVSHFLIS
jgi:hypothetical protein